MMESTESNECCRRISGAVRGSTKMMWKRIKEFTYCTDCGFKSKRAFNVIRHYERIHKPTKRVLRCCGKKFLTKCQFYQHCVDVHPQSRKSSIVALTKYRITTNAVRKEETVIRRSSRNATKSIKKEIKQEFDFDEDTPLIYYVNNRKLIKNEEKKSIKLEKNYKELDVGNCIEIFFKGDPKSPFHAKIQREYLRNIDFDHFKIL